VLICFLLFFHINKSHYAINGSLAVIPIGVTPVMFNLDVQQNICFQRQCAAVPNLFMKKRKNRKRLSKISQHYNQDYHKVFKLAFSSFEQYYDDGVILWRDARSKMVTLKPYLHMIIGDSR